MEMSETEPKNRSERRAAAKKIKGGCQAKPVFTFGPGGKKRAR